MSKQRLCVILALVCIVVFMMPFAASATEVVPVDNGFSADGMCYYRDGVMVTNEVILHEGAYYAFDASGWRYTGQEFWLNGSYYRAKEDGTLYVNEWYQSPWWEEDLYYYGAEGKAASDFVLVDGTWYFFYSNGNLERDKVVWSEVDQEWTVLSEDGASYAKIRKAGWAYAFGNWYYAETVDGGLQVVMNAVKKIDGVLYAFDWNGRMADGEQLWVENYSYRAKAGGALITSAWYQDADGDWYYYDAEGKGKQDFWKDGATWYFFGDDGMMRQDCYVWSNTYQAYYVLSQDGTAHVELKEGWNAAFGEWYYCVNDQDYGFQVISGETYEIDGKQYYFAWDGKLVTEELVQTYDQNWNWVSYVADKDGVLQTSGWYQDGGSWGYLQNGEQLYNGVYEIEGKLYAFNWYELVTEGGLYNDYFVTDKTGVLYRNTWYYRTIRYPEEIGWVYYGEDGAMLRNTAQKIGGSYYGFDYDGVMLTNTIESFDGVAYKFKADGTGSQLVDGWYRHPETQEWMYVADGDLAEGFLTISGKTYSFYDGFMEYATWSYGVYNDVYGCYLFDEDGEIVTKPGWYQMYYWYYIQKDGTLAEGWLQDGSAWYYLDPTLVTDEIFYEGDEQLCYYADKEGVCKALTGSGLQTAGYNTVYLQNGKALENTWKQVSGSWYYFGESGFAYKYDSYEIGGAQYLFDRYGKLQTGGWVYSNTYYEWFYADPANDSALYTGMKTIGGQQYIFNSYGMMYSGGLHEYDGKTYLLANDGRVLSSFAKEGWNQVGSTWYYVMDGQLVRNSIIEDNGKYYGFNYDGEMLFGGIKNVSGNEYIFAKGGEILTGWQLINGKWAYGDPEYMYAYTGWDYYIDGKQYYFDWDGFLMTGTFVRYGWIYTTDADGAVISATEVPEGWNYEELEGRWTYVVDDNHSFTGWVGDYYIEDGNMVYDDVVEYNGKLYYLKANGLLLRNGWAVSHDYNYYGDESWVLARADGSLYCSEWVLQGGTWYYFYSYVMAQNTVEYIDGAYHEFDENGKWLGEVEYDYDVEYQLGLSDGWHLIKGEWYYYNDGLPYMGEKYIGGQLYYFDYDGTMVKNEARGQSYSVLRYFGSDGAAVKYTGWKLLGGDWYYFNPDHTLFFGMVKDSSGWCYTRRAYDEDTDSYYCELVSNEYIQVGNSLYYFDASGHSKGEISAKGWYQAGENWYYFENGAMVSGGYRVIGGKGYYFYYDGCMAADVVVGTDDGVYYFNASGEQVTRQGWYKTGDGDWVYVKANGQVYYSGIYFIGGTQYTFRNGILISE